jgi:CRISPR/Cas system-associated exonuclease Cas4 (RecB family)
MLAFFINEIVEKYIRMKEKPRVIGIYYPSEIVNCLRKAYLDYTIGRKEHIANTMLMLSGTFLHKFFEEIFSNVKEIKIDKEYKIYTFPETEVTYSDKDFQIVGRADEYIIIKSYTDDKSEDYLLELKTVSDITLIDKPKESHKMQLNFYLHFFPSAKGILVYIERDTFAIKAFEIKYSEELFRKLIERAEKLHKSLKENRMPEVEKNIAYCFRCKYFDICFGEKKSLNIPK